MKRFLEEAKVILSSIGLTVVLVSALILVFHIVPRGIWGLTHEDYYAWPKVTKCEICQKTIYTWQGHERRPIGVELDNPQGLAVSCSMSGLFHKDCHGTPAPRKWSVKAASEY
jgi:hypothetical protein